jgi:hypothetical protein
MPWMKVLVSDANNGLLAKAKGDAVLVLFAARSQHATHGHGGIVPPGRLDPARLRDEARGYLASVTEKRIAEAIHTLLDLKLLAALQDGSFRLCEYGAEVMPSCMRCRKPNEDHRYANCPACRQLQAAELRAKRHAESRVTSRDGARVTQRDRTGSTDACLLASGSDSVPEQNSRDAVPPVPGGLERAKLARSVIARLGDHKRAGGDHGPA